MRNFKKRYIIKDQVEQMLLSRKLDVRLVKIFDYVVYDFTYRGKDYGIFINNQDVMLAGIDTAIAIDLDKDLKDIQDEIRKYEKVVFRK